MNYFEAKLSYVNGKPILGSLPKNFVNAYINKETSKAYFSLDKSILIPLNQGITEITETEFKNALEEIQKIELKKREEEYQQTIQKLNEKRQEQEQLKQDVLNVKNAFLTSDERFKSLNIDEISLEELKKFKIEQLKELCTKSIYNGFTSKSTGYEFGFNELDQTNFTQQLLLIVSSGGPNNYSGQIMWKTKSSSVVSLTALQFVSIVSEAEEHKRNNQLKYWDLESKVLNSGTNEDVTSVNW